MESVWQDVRYAIRTLRRSPGFSVVVILTLVLGIGGNAALFSVANNVFLRPLPFPEAERLVRVLDYTRAPDGSMSTYSTWSRDILAVQEQRGIFDGMVALSVESATLTGGETPERVQVVSQSGGWSSTLDVKPVVGRWFSMEEERAGSASSTAVISHGLWQRRFSRDRNVLGKTLTIDDRIFAIAGVMPRDFNFPYDAEVWIPTTIRAEDNSRDFALFARLGPGISLKQAGAAVDGVAQRIKEKYPETVPGFGMELLPMRTQLIGEEDRIALALLGIAGIFLLIACVNVSNLLLARSVIRQREIAIRAALGASRYRQIRQLLTESCVLALLGGLGGLLVVAWCGAYLTVLIPRPLSQQLNMGQVGVDARVFAFGLGISLLTGMIFGLAPALRTFAGDLQPMLKEGGRADQGVGRNRRVLNALVVCEVALAMVLLAGAGLMIQNFERLRHHDLGFQAGHLFTLQITPPVSRYAAGEPRGILVRQILEKVRSAPGIVAAGVTTVNPLGGTTWSAPVAVEGFSTGAAGTSFSVNHRLISAGLLAAMEIPLLAGRDFNELDTPTAQPVVIVSRKMARRFWPNEDALGKHVRLDRPNRPWLTVVGIAGDVKDAHETGEPEETWYLPYAQQPGGASSDTIQLMVRSPLDSSAAIHTAQQAIWAVDKNLATYDISGMDRYYAESISQDRLGAIVIALIAGFGLLMAILGIYGVMAFVVNQRTREIGLRMALGAAPRDILHMLLKQGLSLAVAGLAIGLVAAAALSRILSSVLTEVSVKEPAIYVGVAVILLSSALLACYLPARRAMRVDPMVALRYE